MTEPCENGNFDDWLYVMQLGFFFFQLLLHLLFQLYPIPNMH